MLEVFERILQEKETKVAQEDLDFLCGYFFKVEVWGYYELRLYNSTLLLLPPELAVSLTKTAYENSYRFKDFPKYYKTTVSILVNTLIYLMGGQHNHPYIDHYETFKSYIMSMDIKEEDLYIKNQLLFIDGIVEIKKGNKERGIELATSAFHTLELLNAPNIAFGIKTYLDFVLKSSV